MLLAVDVGNTQTVFGLYDGEALGERFRIATEAQRTGDELGALLDDFVDFDALDGICLSSTVPRLIREYEHVAERWAKVALLVIGPGVKTGIPIQHDAPHEIGPDRIVNAVAAKDRYGAPAIVVDFGTSTNFDVVSPEGEYVGGVLAPGVEVSMDALFARAARLVKVDYVAPPAVIGKSTASALQSGLVYGFAGQVDGIVDAIRGELGVEAPAIATGGLAELIAPHARTIETVDPFLTLDGLRLVWERNR
ncbi:MAG TPA: type III pantothenate kinase [Gaiellaceae bacterium]|jgi:type III pantothenate kinase|nr:type III pantothenate kinase [Gaiellaceae bacterium]